MAKHIGVQSVSFDKPVSIAESASTVGTKEGEGGLREYFDNILCDNLAGQKSWEKAESEIVKVNIALLLKKSGYTASEIDYILTGDLLNQCCGSTFGIKKYEIPYFGLFGACSTFGEAMSLGSIVIDSGAANRVIAAASSHFCSAEKQFRFPLGVGNQRPPTATWTVTGDGAVVLENSDKPPYITKITTGRIVDYGIKDSNNMGPAMAPAAADVIEMHLKDFNLSADYYDLIVTGDLGYVGKKVLLELLKEKSIDIEKNHIDCGIEIYDSQRQDTHAGGSGCACSAVVFSGMLFKKLKSGELNRILFIPTGALMSPTSIAQGESIGGIAHCLAIENTRG